MAALDRGENYKESDAVQLKAESVLEGEDEDDRIAKAIQPEFKSEVKDVTPEEVKADITEIRSSAAAPGIPGRTDSAILTIEKKEGRRKCPECNNENPQMIHESSDKSNIILDYPRVYGKKFKCGSCGVEWRER